MVSESVKLPDIHDVCGRATWPYDPW